MSDNANLKTTVQRAVSLLVRGNYEALDRMTHGSRLTAAEIAAAIGEYRGQLVMPPDDVFDNLDVIEVGGARPRKWSVRVNLWIAQEGRSDLTLELTLSESEGEIYGVEIDNIHAL